MIAYLDTNVAVWLSNGKLRQISKEATRVIQTARLLISPMAVLELEYLYDLGRTRYRSRETLRKLEREIDLQICSLTFAEIADTAIDEGWTTDPFDRVIVANARANGFAPLLSADQKFATHYPKTIW